MNDQSHTLVITVPLIAIVVLAMAVIKLTSIVLVEVIDIANYLINYRHLPYLIYKGRKEIDKQLLSLRISNSNQ